MNDKQVYETTLKLYNNCCALCGKPYPQLHHIRFGGLQGGRKTYMGNIIPLCVNCHQLVHSNKKKWQPILIEMIDKKIGDNL